MSVMLDDLEMSTDVDSKMPRGQRGGGGSNGPGPSCACQHSIRINRGSTPAPHIY